MPTRPRSHVLESLSKSSMRQEFEREGWVVDLVQEDYGEDLLVRIFDKEDPTNLMFWVQAKATDHVERYLDKGRQYLSYPLDTDHVEHWLSKRQPVIVTLWDSQANNTYWEFIQSYFGLREGRKSLERGTRKVRIRIPVSNTLDKQGVKRIRIRTQFLFEREAKNYDVVKALITILEEDFKSEVSYDENDEVLMVSLPDGGERVFFFGRLAKLVEVLSDRYTDDLMYRVLEGVAQQTIDLARSGSLEQHLRDEHVKKVHRAKVLGLELPDPFHAPKLSERQITELEEALREARRRQN